MTKTRPQAGFFWHSGKTVNVGAGSNQAHANAKRTPAASNELSNNGSNPQAKHSIAPGPIFFTLDSSGGVSGALF
jgi:hypothetical protein